MLEDGARRLITVRAVPPFAEYFFPNSRLATCRPAASLRKMVQARDLIREYFAEPIALADCAAEAGLSPWHLLRAFRDTFGETPKEYVTRLRIERAQQLLTVTERSVTEVCFDVGFSSLGTFSVLFKRHVGISPITFRRQVRCLVRMPGYTPWTFIPYCYAHRFGGVDK